MKASGRLCAVVVLSGRRLSMPIGESNVAVHRDLTVVTWETGWRSVVSV